MRLTPVSEERVAATYCDPAGGAANPITGTSQLRELLACGVRAFGRASRILDGIEQIRRALRSGDGHSQLVISPRCVRLIEAPQCYHYPEKLQAPSETPFKDGVYDHPVDALRYFFHDYHSGHKARYRPY